MSCRNAMIPPPKIAMNTTTMRTQCFSAKAMIEFMALLRSPAANIERLSFAPPIDEGCPGNDTICRGKPFITSTILPLVSQP